MVQFDRLAPLAIDASARMRHLDEDAVCRLVQSIRDIGLQTPISVRWAPDEDAEYSAILIAGAHRLEAAKRLGWDFIDVAVHDGDERDARLWEIAENLHRSELSPVERAEHIDEWRKLTAEKVSQIGTPSGGRQPNEAGVRKTAETLGVSKQAVTRSAQIASLPQETRDQAREEGWSQTRLLDEARPSKPAPAIKNAFESEEDWRRALFTVWNRGAQDWRERAMEAMDRPLFDSTGAGR